MCTKIYDVTVVEVSGDGEYLDFKFKDVSTGAILCYTLRQSYNGGYPQEELVYTNTCDVANGKNHSEVVKFAAPMPEGYNVAFQITRDDRWRGITGVLSVTGVTDKINGVDCFKETVIGY